MRVPLGLIDFLSILVSGKQYSTIDGQQEHAKHDWLTGRHFSLMGAVQLSALPETVCARDCLQISWRAA